MRIKRFTAGLLATAMTFTSPMSSFAGAGVITGRGGGFSFNSHLAVDYS